MRTRLDIMIHVDMDCDELLLGGVNAVDCHVVGHTRHVRVQSRSRNVSVALVRCMALTPLSRDRQLTREINVVSIACHDRVPVACACKHT